MALTPQEAADLARRYNTLLEARQNTKLALKPTPLLRQTLHTKSGEVPLTLRTYQAQGVFHLLQMPRLVLGDGTGLGKTLQVLAACCHLLEREQLKIVVVTPKAAVLQWASEIRKFTHITAMPVVGPWAKRYWTYKEWQEHEGSAILVVSYALFVRDWDEGAFDKAPKTPPPAPVPKGTRRKKGEAPPPKAVEPPPALTETNEAAPKPTKQRYRSGFLDEMTTALARNKKRGQPSPLMVVFDEATAFKNTSTQVWHTANQLARKSSRVYGLSATIIKNAVIEAFSIFRLVTPWVFPTKKQFLADYCTVWERPLAGGGTVSIIQGYKNLGAFRSLIDPYFLGRAKHEVSAELPVLTTKRVYCELSDAEDALYHIALDGVLELGDGTVKEYESTAALTSLIYCQQIVNSLSLLQYGPGVPLPTGHKAPKLSTKEALLLELLDGELAKSKVIVYTRFASLVPRLQALLKEQKIKSVAITGAVSAKGRLKAQEAFQDATNDTYVIFITDAGSEALNLQAAEAIVFYDAPWSHGTYVQLLGRPIRIGSAHTAVCAYHLITRRNQAMQSMYEDGEEDADDGGQTIDGDVIDTLLSKAGLIEQVLGKTAQGALEFSHETDQQITKALYLRLQQRAQKHRGKGPKLKGAAVVRGALPPVDVSLLVPVPPEVTETKSAKKQPKTPKTPRKPREPKGSTLPDAMPSVLAAPEDGLSEALIADLDQLFTTRPK